MIIIIITKSTRSPFSRILVINCIHIQGVSEYFFAENMMTGPHYYIDFYYLGDKITGTMKNNGMRKLVWALETSPEPNLEV